MVASAAATPAGTIHSVWGIGDAGRRPRDPEVGQLRKPGDFLMVHPSGALGGSGISE